MPNTKSAKRKVKKVEKQALINKFWKRRYKLAVKKMEATLKKNNKNYNIYFIIGADNLINFHKWYKWRTISKKCNILVFDRLGYKNKSLKSITFKRLNKKSLKYINFKKINISSSKLRKI